MRQQQKAQTRTRVLDAARACFAERGFERTTIAMIAKRARVSVGTVHAHFDHKIALLAASLYDEIERVLGEAWRGSSGEPLERLEQAARSLYGWYATDVPRSRTLLAQTAFLKGEWGDRFDDQIARFTQEVATAFAQAIADGELTTSAPPGLLAMGFMGDYLAILFRGLRADAFDVDGNVAQLMALTRLRCGLPA